MNVLTEIQNPKYNLWRKYRCKLEKFPRDLFSTRVKQFVVRDNRIILIRKSVVLLLNYL